VEAVQVQPESDGGAPRPSALTNLFGLDRVALRDRFAAVGEQPWRADQVMQWIYRRGVDDFAAMTNLSQKLRQRLTEVAEVRPPELLASQVSVDGTRKWVLRVDGGEAGARRRRSRRYSFQTVSAARSAFPARSAAPWTAASAPPPSRASSATSRPPRSSPDLVRGTRARR
jgi:23S rRNA m(2)A-2503 methyltransferase (EC 2.1.1.-)